jgi:magnesium-transporting ATPase (P-type)
MAAFTFVLGRHGWSWGETPSTTVLALASGTAFAAIAIAQMANAFACRSTTRPVWRMDLLGNRLVVLAVAAELALLMLFLGVPVLAELLGGSWPPVSGWLAACVAGVALVGVDGAAKARRRRPR